MRVGLRIDSDTFRGTRDGLPNLCRLLAAHRVTGTVFVCLGPDNMGRHLWRLLRPTFLAKVLRSRAASLYGWDILLKGTFWPGPEIGRRLGPTIRAAADAGHEVGLHAWDHHAWQAHAAAWDVAAARRAIQRGAAALAAILGRPPTCAAAPAWRGTAAVLAAKADLPFAYHSDCRGTSVFLPVAGGVRYLQPQVPTTLPTYDEVIGRNGVTDANYNERLLEQLRPDGLNVLTIHAEVEGLARFALFERFLDLAAARGVTFAPLGSLLTAGPAPAAAEMLAGAVPGRDGWVAVQGATVTEDAHR